MRTTEALKIIQSLANGLDPQTNRELPPGTPFEQPPVIRALFAAARALEAVAQQEGNAAPAPSAQPAPPPNASPSASPPAAAPAIPSAMPSLGLSVNASPPAPLATPTQATSAPNPVGSVATASASASASGYFDRPLNAGKAWSREEDARLANGFDRGVSLEVLAQIHARTLASIQSRLEKLGKLPPSPSPPPSAAS